MSGFLEGGGAGGDVKRNAGAGKIENYFYKNNAGLRSHLNICSKKSCCTNAFSQKRFGPAGDFDVTRKEFLLPFLRAHRDLRRSIMLSHIIRQTKLLSSFCE